MNSATLHTSVGDIVIELFPNHAPKTVANFVELATGAKEWVDPNIGQKVKTNLYDGTIFHRVIPGAATAWLNRKHSIFGEVKDAASQKVVDAIVGVKTGANDKPVQAVKITSVSFK